jgi:hypothetical protein
VQTIRSRMTTRRELRALERRHLVAIREAEEAGVRLDTERLVLLGALGVEPRGPISVERRVDLEVRQGVLVLEGTACRSAAHRARSALGVVRSPQFRRWYVRAGAGAARAGDVAIVAAFCATHPEVVPIR